MKPRIRGVLAPVLTPFDATLGADVGRFVAHCRWLVGAESRRWRSSAPTPRRPRSPSPSGWPSPTRCSKPAFRRAADARHRRLGPDRCGRADARMPAIRRGRRPDAAALLLQGRLRRRRVRLLRRGDRAGRQRLRADLPLSHPPGHAGADHAGADRAAAEALSGGRRRRQGFVRRLEQLEGDDRRTSLLAASTSSRRAKCSCRGRLRSAAPAASARRST